MSDNRRQQNGLSPAACRSSRRKTAAPLIWKLGDRVRVRAERIDPMRRRVEFALVTGTPPAP